MFKSDHELGQLVSGLILALIAMADRNNIARGTLAGLLGVTPTRLGQLVKSATEGQPLMVGLDVFLRLVTLCKAEKQMRADGVLPRPSKRAEAQHAIYEYCEVPVT